MLESAKALSFPHDFVVGPDYTIPPKLLETLSSPGLCAVRAPSGCGFWLLTRDRDVRRAFADPLLSRALAFSGAPRLAGADLTSIHGCVFNSEDQDHGRLRDAIKPLFKKSGLAHWRVLAAAEARRLLQMAGANGRHFDLRSELAEPLLWFLGETALGIDANESRVLRDILRIQSSLDAEPGAIEGATNALIDSAQKIITRPTSEFGLLSSLKQSLTRGVISESEAVASACFLLFNAFDPLVPPLVLGIMRVSRDPTAQMLLQSSRTDARRVVAEIMRFHNNSVLNFPRIARANTESYGQPIAPGEAVVTSTLAAGWDPDVVSEPHIFKVQRPYSTPIAFGEGRHRCLGLEFAMDVLESSLTAIFERAPSLTTLNESNAWEASDFLFMPPRLEAWF